MTKEQIKALEELVEVNEKFRGYRIVIDYAIQLATIFNPSLNKEMTFYVEKLYRDNYHRPKN